jgi:hypothetical protein
MPSPYNTVIATNPHTPHPTSTGSGHLGRAPMDLSAAGRCLSPEECQKQIDEGRCLYCGGFNHMARDCPNKSRTPGRSLQGAVAMTEPTPEVPAYADSNLQSGNV